jgi:hypothetical protein
MIAVEFVKQCFDQPDTEICSEIIEGCSKMV